MQLGIYIINPPQAMSTKQLMMNFIYLDAMVKASMNLIKVSNHGSPSTNPNVVTRIEIPNIVTIFSSLAKPSSNVFKA